MSYERNKNEWLIEGEGQGILKGRAQGRAEGLTNLIIILGESDFSDDQIFTKVKSRYGKYFTDEQIKQFMNEAKGTALQEA